MPTVFLWTLNFLILGACLVKMLVYGDPIIASKSVQANNFWHHKRKAEHYIDKVRIIPVLVCFLVNFTVNHFTLLSNLAVHI